MELLLKQLQVYIEGIEDVLSEMEEQGQDVSSFDLYIQGLWDEFEALEEEFND